MTPHPQAGPTVAGLFAAGCRLDIPAGGVLFRQGDAADRIFLIEAGRVRMVRYLAAGHEVALHTGRAGELFAEGALFADTYQCDGRAAEAATVMALAKADVLAAFAASPALALELLARVTRQLHAARTLVELRDVRSAHGRVLRHLQLRADSNGMVVVEGRLLDAAAELGLTREAYYRALAALAEQGAIRRGPRRIQLVQPLQHGSEPSAMETSPMQHLLVRQLGMVLVLLTGSAATALAQAPVPGMAGMQHGAAVAGAPAGPAANHQEMMAAMERMNSAMMAPAAMAGDADQNLVAMMIPHHQGAIDMAHIYLREGSDPAIRRMAQKIIADQQREIREMRAWQARHPVSPR